MYVCIVPKALISFAGPRRSLECEDVSYRQATLLSFSSPSFRVSILYYRGLTRRMEHHGGQLLAQWDTFVYPKCDVCPAQYLRQLRIGISSSARSIFGLCAQTCASSAACLLLLLLLLVSFTPQLLSISLILIDTMARKQWSLIGFTRKTTLNILCGVNAGICIGEC